MPEGDSYTRAAARARPVLVGRRILDVAGSSPAVRKHAARMRTQAVEEVRTIGKHLLVDLASGITIHIHLGMPGRVQVTADGRRPGGDPGAVRLALVTEAGTVSVLAAPTVEVDRRAAIERSLERLGPDLLAAEFAWDEFAARAGRYPGDRTVSDFLLDQRVMAGIGNEYKSEVLFLERLAPDRLMVTIDPQARTALAERARRVMLPNARRPVRSTTGRSDGSAWVYDRTGRPCRRCRTAIAEEWIGDPPRITYWCPSCQTQSKDGTGAE